MASLLNSSSKFRCRRRHSRASAEVRQRTDQPQFSRLKRKVRKEENGTSRGLATFFQKKLPVPFPDSAAFTAQARRMRRKIELSFRPLRRCSGQAPGEIFLRSLALARDDGSRPVTWRSWRPFDGVYPELSRTGSGHAWREQIPALKGYGRQKIRASRANFYA